MRSRLLGLVLPLVLAPLAVVTIPAPALSLGTTPSEVTVTTDQPSYTIGDTAHITGTLVTGANNGDLSIYATVDGTKSLLTSGPVDGNGQLAADLQLTKATTTTFTVEYAGDPQYDPSSASASVAVNKKATTVKVATDRASYRYGGTAHVRVTLASGSGNRTVRLYKVINGNRSLVKKGAVPVGGALSASVTLSRRTTFQATYAGDAQYASDTASRTVTVAARVTPKLLKSRSRSGKFYVYRAGDRVTIQGTVAPNHAGDCLYFRVQYLIGGSYGHDDTSGCVRLSRLSTAGAYLDTNRYYRGHAIRLRAEWRGDLENRAAYSAWRYAKFN